MSSSSKDITQASQPKNAPLVASSGDNQPVNDATLTPQAEGVAAQQPAKVDAPATTTNTQAPVSTPPSSEKPPIPPSDLAPVSTDTEPNPEKVPLEDPPANTTTTGGTPADTGPEAAVDDVQERRRKLKVFIIHTRLARFFSWLLLLSFVILPGTFKETGEGSTCTVDSKTGDPIYHPDTGKSVENSPLFAIGLVCCVINGCAISYLWHLRKDDPEWLFVNLFFAGLVNAFSGLVTAFVSIYGVHGGPKGAASTATLILASLCTVIYGVLAFVFYRKREKVRHRRNRGRGPNNV